MKLKQISPAVQQIFRTAFPGYRGRKWRIEAREFKEALSFWDSGSRNDFCLVSLTGGGSQRIAEINPIAGLPFPPAVPIPPGTVLVEHSRFGTSQSIRIHCNPADLDRLLIGCVAETR